MLKLGLGIGLVYGAGSTIPPAPSGITISNSEIDDGAIVGALVGTMIMVGGVDPGVFTFTSNPGGLWAIDGDRLEVAASLAALGGTVEATTIRVTDAIGQTFDAVLNITIAVAAGANDSGIGEGDGVIVVPDPDDPAADTGGFEVTPIQQDTSEGLRIAGRNGGSATFLKDLGAPVAGNTYVMKYSADWSGMSKLGRQAAIGFAFKSGNNFHLVGLRGDNGQPTTTMLASRVYGDFRKSNQFTVTDDGTAANGTKDGPNWEKIEIAADGTTYTLSSSADGLVWNTEYTAVLPTPLASADAALQFGPGGYFTNQDKGVFSITIETFTGLATVPAQFGTGDWSVADAGTSGDITISITTLPDDGGSALTDLEYQIDGGAWVSLGAATTGAYPVAGLTDDVEVTVALRAVNAIGNGTASATKAVTPTAADPYFANVVFLAGFEGADGATSYSEEKNSRAATFIGNAQLDTAQFKFGASSLLCDGSGDYTSWVAHADWDLTNANTNPFTIEGFFRFVNATTAQGLVSQWVNGIPQLSWTLRKVSATRIDFLTSSSGSAVTGSTSAASGFTLATNTWYHIAVDNDATGKVRIYVDGVMRGSSTPADNLTKGSSAPLTIGNDGTQYLNGWGDEVRITKGVARYASDGGFTPPTGQFPRA